jgi:MarR family transcriptional regulator, organic hydroperoxide resistance regulator
MIQDDVSLLMTFYPRIYLACHTRHVSDPVKGVKLTAHQGSVLDHLDEDESITMQELALHLGVTPSTMSITVDRLSKLGYIKREKDKRDSRRVNLYLTAHGNKIKRSKSVLDASRVTTMLSRLTESERSDALKGLGLLATAAEMEMKSKSFEKAWAHRGKGKPKPKDI